MQFSVLLAFLFVSVASAASTPRIARRGSGTASTSPAQGTQFITGPCNHDSDCADGCCGFNTGLCAGPVVAQERDGGCGHGDPEPNNNAAVAVAGPNAPKPSGASVKASTATAQGAGGAATQATVTASTSAATGTQFITGPCKSDSDCADGCCGFNTGLCAGPIVAQEQDGGCGFGDPQPNNNAAVAVAGPNAPKPSGASTKAAATASQAGSGSSNASATASTSAATGTQFITGPCNHDSDCANGCCGFNSGKCAGAIVAQERDGGCGHGDPQPNNNAAVALVGPNAPKPGQKD